ncbi:MAG: hypothetical protein KGZ25_05040 [Planctomycetes bacterium]|nr:hypothetical protein [Planctomycetota bacterium]
MRPDLDNRNWPVPFNRRARKEAPKQAGLLHQAGTRSFVSEGYVLAKELAIKGTLRPLPPGESAITALEVGRKYVFGATSGRRAHVFAYNPEPAREAVIPVACLEQHAGVRNSLIRLDGYGLVAGTTGGVEDDSKSGELFRIPVPHVGDVIQEWGGSPSEPETLGVPVKGEGIACMVGDPARRMAYGLTAETGMIFGFDAENEEIRCYEPIDQLGRFSPHLLMGPDGFLYGCATAGQIIQWDPDREESWDTGLFLPSMAGRSNYSEVGDWALDVQSGLIYAGDVADGLVSMIDVAAGEVRVLGKPTRQSHVRAIAVAADGRVYGVAGERDKICHLFCYHPPTREMRDLGVLVAGTERRWYGYEFECAVASADGRVYFGESERVSHLFVYFPPLKPVTGTESSCLEAPKEIGPSGSQL